MAYQDQFYTTGTAKVTNGSNAVTGTGNGWATALITGGVFYAGGGAYPIATVNSETSLTLAIPYSGATAAAVAYAIDRQRASAISNIAMNDRLAQIIREITIGNVEQLNALGLVANKAISTNADGKLQLIDLGALGQILLALAPGNNSQILQGDGTLSAKSALPITTPMQTALDGKLGLTGGNLTGSLSVAGTIGTSIASSSGNQYGRVVQSAIGTGTRANLMANLNAGNFYAAVIQLYYDGLSREYFFKSNGSFTAPGEIIGSAKNFEIDHTVDPANYDLRHCATEAPEMLVEYRGTAQLLNGRSIINVEAHYGVMEDTFTALWADAWVVALQNQDGFDRVKPSRINGATFEIVCENPNSNDLITWVVMARRNDPYVRWDGCTCTDAEGRLIIEFEKPEI